MAPKKVIIDTDPGIDDVLAMLLAFSAKAEQLEILMVSATYGNVDVHGCLRNILSIFHTLERELAWRRETGRPEGFDALRAHPPLVAVGAEKPLAEEEILFDGYYGKDGLSNIHTSHPHLSPTQTWHALSASPKDPSASPPTLFTPTTTPSHKLILQLLRDNPAGSITIAAVAPMTTLAHAALEDLETFSRVGEVVVMGGAVGVPGNVTPHAEFNTHTDPLSLAHILSLTSPTPASTSPPSLPGSLKPSAPSPKNSARIPITLLPLDITSPHTLTTEIFQKHSTPHLEAHSPLAEWTAAFLTPALDKAARLEGGGLGLHDPLALYFAETSRSDAWQVEKDEDVRVETQGQWTRGASVVDRRGFAGKVAAPPDGGEVAGDQGGWRDERLGNRVGVVVGSGFWDTRAGGARQGKEDHAFGEMMVGRLFGG